MAKIGRTDLDVFGLQLGGNPFGWTADAETSHAILDRYAEAGGDFIDTADVYSAWIDGNEGGESERIIGDWLRSRKNRDSVVIATKVGSLAPYRTLDRDHVRKAVEGSLRRLGTDHIDIYYAHRDDAETPLEETAAAFGELVAEGKVRYLGASNFSAERLEQAIETARGSGLPEYTVVQDDYSLVNRAPYEFGTRRVAAAYGLVNLPFRSLAKGFLAGKYRPGKSAERTTHSAIAESYLERYGHGLLTALDLLAHKYHTTQAAIGLAWLTAQPTVVVPLAGARNLQQLESLLPVVDVRLEEAEVRLLSELTEPSDPSAGEN